MFTFCKCQKVQTKVVFFPTLSYWLRFLLKIKASLDCEATLYKGFTLSKAVGVTLVVYGKTIISRCPLG